MTEKNAKIVAITLLSMRSYSIFELKIKLRKRGFTEEEILPVIENFEQWGYLNDGEERQRRVTSYKRRGYSPLQIEIKLKAAGLERKSPLSSEEEREIIRKLLDKPSWKRKSFQQKVGSLQRRGFTRASIFACLKKGDEFWS